MKKWIIGIIAIVVVVTGLYALTFLPHKIITIKPSNVSKIVIFDGTQGEQIVVTDEEQKEHIISNLNEITFQKERLSLFYIGYRFRTTIYNKKGNVYKEIIINSSDKIRYAGFFHRAKSGKIDYEYIDQLFETNHKEQ